MAIVVSGRAIVRPECGQSAYNSLATSSNQNHTKRVAFRRWRHSGQPDEASSSEAGFYREIYFILLNAQC